VSPGFFEMLEIPVVRGRAFTEWDGVNAPNVAVISEGVAQRYFPNEDAVGKLVTLGRWQFDEFDRREIVGVVADVRQVPHREPFASVYLPHSQLPRLFHGAGGREYYMVTFVVRTAGDPASLDPAMRELVSEVASDIPVLGVETIEDIRSDSTRWSRFYTWLLTTFAGLAVVLAAVGVFGVISYSVTRRTHEIGIRMALGADRHDVLRLVMRQALVMTSMGLVIGLGGAYGLTRFLESQLHEVEPTDPVTFAVVAVILAAVALLASLLPARRATRVNPIQALHHE
jgi:putative ABC transport system permease protein